MVFSPDGKLIYVVCRESRAVAIVDAKRGEMVDKIETNEGCDAMVCLFKDEVYSS